MNYTKVHQEHIAAQKPCCWADTVRLAEDCLELHAKLEERQAKINEVSLQNHDLYTLAGTLSKQLATAEAELAKLRPTPKFRLGQLVHVRTWIACYKIERIDIAAGEIRYKLNSISTPQPPSELSAVLPEEIK